MSALVFEAALRICGTRISATKLVAHWDDPQGRGGLTTQAERLSDLETNIRDAVEVHFEPSELPSRIRLHFENDPVLAAA